MPKDIPVISKEQYSYMVPTSYGTPMPKQGGGTCGLCAANHALNLLHAYEQEEYRPEEWLVEQALQSQFSIGGNMRPLTYTGEIFHPEQFAEFITAQSSKVIASCMEYDRNTLPDLIGKTVAKGGYVMVPFNVSLYGFPENPPPDSESGAHWCLIAGYREEDPR